MDTEILQNAGILIKNGGVVLFPTDSSYALGCDYRRPGALKRIMEIKGRENGKFTLIAASLEQALEHFPLPEEAVKLARTYWPGPLSIVVNDHFAIRVPDYAPARTIAEAAGTPIVATSANKSGEAPEFAMEDAWDALATQKIDLAVDGGELPERDPSTVIRVVGSDVEVIRQGPITLSHE